MRSILAVTCLCALVMTTATQASVTVNFEDLTLAPESEYNGGDLAGGFVSGDAWLSNIYDPNYFSWEGFAYSNHTDTTSTGWAAQYNAITGGGQGGSEIYGVSWVGWSGPPTISFTTGEPVVLDGAYFTNTSYAYYSMLYGDAYAKPFGGDMGDEPDWFKLSITGIDGEGDSTGPVEFYLADYRFEDNEQDYIVDDWTWVDLSGLGAVVGLQFGLSSSDVGGLGMNTPAYFAIDSIPEPATAAFLALAGVVSLVRRRKR